MGHSAEDYANVSISSWNRTELGHEGPNGSGRWRRAAAPHRKVSARCRPRLQASRNLSFASKLKRWLAVGRNRATKETNVEAADIRRLRDLRTIFVPGSLSAHQLQAERRSWPGPLRGTQAAGHGQEFCQRLRRLPCRTEDRDHGGFENTVSARCAQFNAIR